MLASTPVELLDPVKTGNWKADMAKGKPGGARATFLRDISEVRDRGEDLPLSERFWPVKAPPKARSPGSDEQDWMSDSGDGGSQSEPC